MKRLLVVLFCFILFGFSFLPNGVQAESTINEEMIYNILLDRYNIGNQAKSEQVRVEDPYAYHGGDLRGLTAKLGEIQELGYTAISISPIMKNAANGYHGYWIEDFFEVEEQFGTMDDLHKLVEAAHQRGIKVLLELVTNYVATSHPFVKDQSKETWFKQHDLTPTDSTYWLEDVIVLNQDNAEVVQYLLEVADFWMDETDIDGFDLHAIEQISETFLNELITHISDKDPSFYLTGNVLDVQAPIDHIDIPVENNELYTKIVDIFSEMGAPVSEIYATWEEIGKDESILFVDNEHTPRFSQVVAENGRNATTAWKLALTYLYTTPGTPSIFQGSELTMYGGGFPENQRLVPFHSGEQELEQFFHRISALKKEFAPLSNGTFEQVATSGSMSVFKRTFEDETIFIAINNDVKSQAVQLSDIEPEKRLRGVLGDNLARENNDGTYTVGIPRESVEVYMIEDDTGFNWWLIGFIVSVMLIFIIAVIYLSKKEKARST